MTEAVEAAMAEGDTSPVVVTWAGLDVTVPPMDAWTVIGVQLAERKGDMAGALIARVGEDQADAIYEHAATNRLGNDDFGALMVALNGADASGEAEPPRS